MDQAVDGALWATFFHQGQVCESGTRLLLPESIHDEFVERLVERAQADQGRRLDGLRVRPRPAGLGGSSARRSRATCGSARRRARSWCSAASGPQGDGYERGYWFEPTIFTEVDNSMTIAQEEIFGPVLSVIKFNDDDDAIRIANDSIYGLASGVWSSDPDRCLETAKRLRAGTVWINDYHLINCIAPFGGYKQSGIGRELGGYGLNEYTEVKHVHWDLGTPAEQKLFGVLSQRVTRLRASLRLRLLAEAKHLAEVLAVGLQLALAAARTRPPAGAGRGTTPRRPARGRRGPGSSSATRIAGRARGRSGMPCWARRAASPAARRGARDAPPGRAGSAAAARRGSRRDRRGSAPPSRGAPRARPCAASHSGAPPSGAGGGVSGSAE